MAEAAEQPKSGRYLGQYLHTVGPSHRIKLPSVWRRSHWPNRFFILPWPVVDSNHLLVLTEARWDRMAENLEGYSLADDDIAAVDRLISSTVTEVELDASGRLALPADGVNRLAIGDQVRLVGRISKFEVWNPETYQAVEAECQARVAGIVKKIEL